MIVSQLRKEAREKLKGKWKNAILFMLIFYISSILISYIFTLISFETRYGIIISIFRTIITTGLNYGIICSFIKLKRNEKVNFLHFIVYAIKYTEKVWKIIGRFLLRLIWYIIGFLLSIYLVIIECISLYNGYGVRLSFFIEIICLILLTILLVKEMLYYQLNNYILFDNEGWKSKQILNESKRLMKNHRWDFIKLIFSFIGWQILGTIFCCGIILALYFFFNINNIKVFYILYIPLIFLTPYINITKICFYDNLLYNNPRLKNDEQNIKKIIFKKKRRKSKNNK